MIYVGLFIFSSIVCIVYLGAGLNLATFKARKEGTKEPGGSSIFPVIPIIPVMLTAIAWVLNHFWSETGYWTGYSLCLLVLLVSIGMISYSQYKIRKFKENP